MYIYKTIGNTLYIQFSSFLFTQYYTFDFYASFPKEGLITFLKLYHEPNVKLKYNKNGLLGKYEKQRYTMHKHHFFIIPLNRKNTSSSCYRSF